MQTRGKTFQARLTASAKGLWQNRCHQRGLSTKRQHDMRLVGTEGAKSAFYSFMLLVLTQLWFPLAHLQEVPSPVFHFSTSHF